MNNLSNYQKNILKEISENKNYPFKRALEELDNEYFVLEIIKNAPIKFSIDVFQNIKKQLITPKLIIETLEILNEKGATAKLVHKYLIEKLPDECLGIVDQENLANGITRFEDEDIINRYIKAGIKISMLHDKLNPKVFDDEKLMKKFLLDDAKTVFYIGDGLTKNSNFIKDILTNKFLAVNASSYFYALLNKIDDSIKDKEVVDAVIDCCKKYGSMNKNAISSICRFLPPDYFKKHPQEKVEFILLGATIDNLDLNRGSELRRAAAKKENNDNFLGRITEKTTVEEAVEGLTGRFRSNQEQMLTLLVKYPFLYGATAPELKGKVTFERKLLAAVPEIAQYIEKDEIRLQIKAAREEKTKQKLDKQNENKKEIIESYNGLLEEHPNYKIVKEFLDSGCEKNIFCEQHNMTSEEFDKIIDNMAIAYPKIRERINKHYKKISEKRVNDTNEIYKKIISGDLSVKEYLDRDASEIISINKLLDKISDKKQREEFHTKVVTAMNSGKLSAMNYLKLFSKGLDVKEAKKTMKKYLALASIEAPKLQKRDKQISKACEIVNGFMVYDKKFNRNEFVGNKKGWRHTDGSMEMYVITDEHVDYAVKYVKATKDYLCYRTVDLAIAKIIKGEISFEKIDGMLAKQNPDVNDFER